MAAEAAAPLLDVEVIAGSPGAAPVALRLASGATVEQALLASGLSGDPLDLRGRIGIFGRLCGLDQRLEDGDRVEIYRPLAADPKDARRRRARKQRA